MSHKTIQLRCSNCGHRSRYTKCGLKGARQLYQSGWRVSGSAFYCRKCAETWRDRNDNDLYPDAFYHISEIMNDMIYCLGREIDYLEEDNDGVD